MASLQDNYKFLNSFYEKISDIYNAIMPFFKSKELIENHFLAGKGFIIKRYELKDIPDADINTIKENLQKFIVNEEQFKNIILSNKQQLKDISLYYLDRKDDVQIDPEKLLIQFNNAVYNARLAIVRLDELTEISKAKKEQKSDEKIKIILSLEKLLNQVIILMSVVEQIQKYIPKIIDLLTPFDVPVVYGRAMGKREFELVAKTKSLQGNKYFVPVFDCPKHTQNKILALDKDARKIFFKKIGVTDSSIILIFQTTTKPINVHTPIPQSNGLKEFKFLNGTRIELLQAA